MFWIEDADTGVRIGNTVESDVRTFSDAGTY